MLANTIPIQFQPFKSFFNTIHNTIHEYFQISPNTPNGFMDAQVQKEKQTTDFLDPEKVKELLIIKVNKKLLQDKEEAVSNDLCSFKCFLVRVELVLTSSFCIQELFGAERIKGDS